MRDLQVYGCRSPTDSRAESALSSVLSSLLLPRSCRKSHRATRCVVQSGKKPVEPRILELKVAGKNFVEPRILELKFETAKPEH